MNKTITKILVVNAGSSSLKYMLFNIANEKMLAKGIVERIGTPKASISYQRTGDAKITKQIPANDHTQAVHAAVGCLIDPEIGVLSSVTDVDAIGHRIVHGGERFSQPVVVTEEVKSGINAIAPLAPLHNPAHLQGIRACEANFPGVPNVVVFDTAFHQTMPDTSYLYALPMKCYKDYGIRKYGFHGTSHKYVTQKAAEMLGKPLDQVNLITCHLGNGSSITAVKNGKCFDTSMGLTPLAGLVMGSRCGDLDPAVVFYLAKQGMTLEAIDTMFNKESGLLALSGTGSGDMRELVNAAQNGSTEAKRALSIFGQRAAMYVAGYYAILGGVDAIIMTGGIGENSLDGRAEIVNRLKALGCDLDDERNEKTLYGAAGRITTDNSKIPVYVIPTNEELMIARETLATLSK